MGYIVCVDELSQKEESLLNILASAQRFSLFIIGIKVYIGMMSLLKCVKDAFDSPEYRFSMSRASKEEIKYIHDKLEGIIFKNERIREKLISIIRIYPQPLLKGSLRQNQLLNDYLVDVLEDIKIALESGFFNAMENIVKGIEESEFDINKVKVVESLF